MERGRQFYRAQEVWIHQRNNFLSPLLLSYTHSTAYMCMNCQLYRLLFIICIFIERQISGRKCHFFYTFTPANLDS